MSHPSQPSGLAAPSILLLGILVGGGFLTMMLWESIPRREPRPRQELNAGPVVELTENNWQTEVVESNVPVLVDVWAEWCGPCRQLSPTIDRLAAQFEGKVKVGKVDLDTNKQLGQRYKISSIPCVMIFNGGEKPKKTLVGLRSEAEYVREIELVLKGR